MTKIAELRSQLEGKQAELDAIVTKDDPGDDELKKADQLAADMEEIGKQIDKYNADKKKLADLKTKSDESKARMKEIVRTTPFPTKVEDKGVEFDSIEAGASEFEKKWPTGGFKTGGHFIWSLVKAGHNRRGEDSPSKLWMTGTNSSARPPRACSRTPIRTAVLLVPTTFSTEIYRRMVAMNNLLEQLNPVTVRGKTMKFLALAENSRVTGSRWGGVRGYWVKEGFQYTASKPQFRNVRLELNKLTVEVVATEELLEDSEIALESLAQQRRAG
jgi:HK97 family phage major capsid protein